MALYIFCDIVPSDILWNLLLQITMTSSLSLGVGRLCRRLCQVTMSDCTLARTLLTPASPVPYKTSAEVIQALSQDVIGGPKNYDPNQYQKKREELLAILPTDQSQLPPRRMLDSYDSAIIPIASDPVLRVNINPHHMT